MTIRKHNYTQEQLNQYFFADPLLGKIFSKKSGKEIGFSHPSGYYMIADLRLLGKLIHLNRSYMIYVLTNGTITDITLDIDHISANTTDDRLVNLRLVSHSKNKLNMNDALRSNNTSGVRGVSYNKWGKRWKAEIKSSDKCIKKYFKTKYEAVRYRQYLESIYAT